MKNKKIITAFLAITFSILSLLTPLACVSAKMDQATTYQESNRKENRRMSVPGTAVPNTGYVGNVYFNTKLSVEEVEDLLSNIFIEDLQSYFITLDSERNNLIKILYQQGIYAIYSENNGDIIYIFSTSIVPIYNIDFVGWNPSFSGFVTYNSIVDFDQMYELSYGKNDLLTSMVSITPFEKVSLIEAIGTGIANSAELFGAVLANAFAAIASVFITNNELTLLGTVLVIAIGATVVSFAIKLILKLIQKIKV